MRFYQNGCPMKRQVNRKVTGMIFSPFKVRVTRPMRATHLLTNTYYRPHRRNPRVFPLLRRKSTVTPGHRHLHQRPGIGQLRQDRGFRFRNTLQLSRLHHRFQNPGTGLHRTVFTVIHPRPLHGPLPLTRMNVIKVNRLPDPNRRHLNFDIR